MSKFIKILACSDLHGDLCDRSTVNAVLDFKKSFKPDQSLFLGDLYDFVALMGKASPDDKIRSLTTDYEVGNEFLRKLHPTVYFHGNHCHRMVKLQDTHDAVKKALGQKIVGEIDDLCMDLHIQQIKYPKYNSVHQIGNLRFIHGFNGSAEEMRKGFGNVVFAHKHTFENSIGATYDRTMSQCSACLCNVDMTYNETQLGTFRQENGFLAILISKATGNFNIFPIRKLDGKFLYPSAFGGL